MEILLIFLLVLGVVVIHGPVSSWITSLYNKHQYKHFLSQETFYHSIISRYLKFYNRLNLEDQRKFLFRTYLFKKSKRFHYIDITDSTREHGVDEKYLTPDKLHYSGKEYEVWATRIADEVAKILM